jgi:guanyl-specific ribonuclease Sa
MRSTVVLLFLTIAVLLAATLTQSGNAQARGLRGATTHWLSCENGSHYAIRPTAVSIEGDLVAGYLVKRQGQGIHVRLIPMGAGYRYAGRGVWFDGWRETVYLYVSKYRSIACTVDGGPELVRG